MALALLMTLSLAASGTVQAQPDPKLVRVWVTTEDVGHLEELAARRESLKDLNKALAKQKKLVALVDKEEAADVTILVKERRTETPRIVFGVGARPGDPPGTITPARTVQLVTVLKWHDERVEFKNKHKPLESALGWESAADDIAKQIQKWVSDHRQRILDARSALECAARGSYEEDLGVRNRTRGDRAGNDRHLTIRALRLDGIATAFYVGVAGHWIVAVFR